MINLMKYYIKKRLPLFIIVLSITLIVTLIYLSSNDFIRNAIRDGKEIIEISSVGLSYIAGIAILYSLLIPIYEFSFKMKRKGCDLFYSLPIKRNKLFLSKYLFGLLELNLILIINFLVLFLTIIIKFNGVNFTNIVFNPMHLLLYLPFLIIIASLLYSLNTFFYTRGNTIFDGILIMILGGFILGAIIYGLRFYLMDLKVINYKSNLLFLNGYHYMPFISIVNITSQFEYLVKVGVFEFNEIYPDMILWSISALFIVLFIILSKKEKAENAEDLSESYFSYKIMIPIYIISLFLFCEYKNFSFIAIIIGGYIAYVIYNRNFLIRKWNLITFIICVSTGFGLMAIKLLIQ